MSYKRARRMKAAGVIQRSAGRDRGKRTPIVCRPACGESSLEVTLDDANFVAGERIWRFACLPIPLFLTTIAVLWLAGLPGTFDPPFLVMGLNFGFSTLASLVVAYLIARSFLVHPTPGLLMLGSGVVVWGLAGVASLTVGQRDINIVVGVHNICVCLSAACHLAGACFSEKPERSVRAAGLSIASVYTAAVGAVVLVALASIFSRAPTFFIQGYGGTPVRQLVVASAVGMFVLTAVLLGGPSRRPLSAFRYWYTLALVLIATGLLGVMTETSHGSALSWVGRGAQFLGGVYMLVAAIAAVRETHAWGISLGEALRESEKRFKVLAAATFEGVAITHNGRFVDANKQLLDMTGYSRSELIGMHVGDTMALEDRKRALRDVVAPGESLSEHELIRKDGTRIIIEAHGRPLSYHGRNVRITAIRDITERKRAEQRLHSLTKRLEALMRALPVGVSFSTDASCQQITGNPAVLAQLEMGATDNISASAAEESAPGRQVQYFHAGRRLTGAELPLQRAVAENAAVAPVELEVHLPSGRRWFAEVSGAPVRDDRGQVLGGVAVIVDMTQHKQMELELQRAKEAAEGANRAKDEFLAVLSHELRTPLTPVLLTACLLERRGDLPPEVQADVQTMRRNVELEARIIDDLLDLTRIARGKLQFEFRPTDIHVLARAAVDVCSRGEGAAVELDLAAREHFVNGDAARLQQLFWNLLNNARKFTPLDGRILVHSSDLPDGAIRIQVSDNGSGIEPERLPRIFDAFEQGDSRRARQFGGLGLGLAICKAVADAHGGTLTASSAGRSCGATFTFEVPTVLAGENTGAAAATAGPGQAALAPLRVLVVEDHLATLKLLARMVADLGHEVRTATDVTSALRVAAGWQFELLVSDLGLPDGTGYDLMRSLGSRAGLRGIALSGFGMEHDVRQSRDAGFAEHLTKPVDLDALEAAIRRMDDCRSPSSAPASSGV